MNSELSDKERLWDEVYSERQRFYQEYFGTLPDDILKMVNLFGIWPGGGLFVFQADKLNDLWIYTTFGLTNPDMPSTVGAEDFQTETDEAGRITRVSSHLVKKEGASKGSNRRGYGYEVIVLTRQKEDWPLGLLQWVANAEILHDAEILDRVERYNGLTVEEVNVGDDTPVNVLIAEAQPPIASSHKLPNGPMKILVMTVIAENEMQYSFEHGREALLSALMARPVRQISDRDRTSVIS